ncbi:MAG: multidrug ABC transporter ATP-binding protein, partial [Pseudomonadota bacterium]
IILTTHYIEEAEAIADRIGVIRNGSLLLVEQKDRLMDRLGQKELRIQLKNANPTVPKSLSSYDLVLEDAGRVLSYSYKTGEDRTGITRLLSSLQAEGLVLADLATRESSLEDIFVDLVHEGDTP